MGVVGVTLVMCLALNVANGGETSSYVTEEGKAIEMPPDADVFRVPPGYNAPQQYTTKYHYEVGIGHTIGQFWFMTPLEVGPDVPYTFGLIGDLGPSFDLNNILTHYENNPQKGQTVLCARDLSYADNCTNHDNNRWDTWGPFLERSAAYQPWIWTARNHEIDFAPDIGETKPFKPYTKRYPTPFKASNGSAPYWYSIKRGPIVLASYSACGKYTPQYKWLEEELPKVNRTETPWLIVMMHCPWYNSYNYHYMEGETMRVIYERWFVRHNVDVVFGGHVHAYERFECVPNIAYNIVNGKSTPVEDLSASVYITTGDGGNLEGLATNMTEPQPANSAYGEASFGLQFLPLRTELTLSTVGTEIMTVTLWKLIKCGSLTEYGILLMIHVLDYCGSCCKSFFFLIFFN